MLKQLLTGLAAVALVASVSAKPITPDEAIARLKGANPKMAAPGRSGKAPRLAHTAKTTKGNPAVYVFNKGENEGYLILSADDAAYPVLGYSDNGNAVSGNLPPQLEWWLGEYARQIEYAAEHGIADANVLPALSLRSTRESIAPMLQTRWDQGEPYYNQCPLVGTDRAYTGCVATAMAQVMKYWNYPEIGKGSISYECADISKRLSMNFALRKFDWENMSDTYLPGQYTETEADAVAYLMKACGYAVKMEYGTDSSGALAMNIANGLTKYFGYDPNILYDMRMFYSASEWDRMIYDNLKNVGPILYGGASMLGGGHSFVLDGYDAETGYFHFNWGWSDMSDGYYSLDALNPDALGTGGGNGGGYNFTQDAVFGMQPPTGKPAEARPMTITQHGSLTASVEEGKLNFDLDGMGQAMWVNYNPQTVKMQFGAIFEPQGNTGGETIRKTVSDIKFSVQSGYGTNPERLLPSVDLASLSLNDGTYKVTFASIEIETGGDDVWTPVRAGYGYVNYVVLQKSGNSYTVKNTEVPFIELVDAQFLNELYFGGLAQVQIKVANDSDIELTKGFAPVLIEATTAQILFIGESVYLTLQPKTEMTREWTTPLNLMQNVNVASPMEFFIAFLDEDTGNFFVSQDKVVMKPNPGPPSLKLLGAATVTGESVEANLPNGNPARIILIDDPRNIQVKARLRLESGVFCYNSLAFLVKPDFSENSSGQVEILALGGQPMFMQSNGLASPFSAKLSYPAMLPGEYYAIMMGYQYGSNFVGLKADPTYIRLKADGSGVGEIPTEEVAEDGEIFNLQGIRVGTDFDSLPAGMYIRNGKKILKK